MKELKGRKLILLLGVPFGVICFYLGNPIFAIILTLIILAGLDEFYKMSEAKGASPNRIFGFIISIFICLSYSGIYSHHQISILGFICLSVISVFIIEIINHKNEPLINISMTFMGILLIPCMLGSAIYVRQIDHVYNSNIVLTLFLSVWLCDTAAFFFGTKYGVKRILPLISPKKSWVGSIAGFLVALAVFYLSFYFKYLGDSISFIDSIILGIISGIFSQLGDFSESMLKRDVKFKDSGNLLRAHGGILDRFDSLLFSTPVIYIYLLIYLEL